MCSRREEGDHDRPRAVAASVMGWRHEGAQGERTHGVVTGGGSGGREAGGGHSGRLWHNLANDSELLQSEWVPSGRSHHRQSHPQARCTASGHCRCTVAARWLHNDIVLPPSISPANPRPDVIPSPSHPRPPSLPPRPPQRARPPRHLLCHPPRPAATHQPPQSHPELSASSSRPPAYVYHVHRLPRVAPCLAAVCPQR